MKLSETVNKISNALDSDWQISLALALELLISLTDIFIYSLKTKQFNILIYILLPSNRPKHGHSAKCSQNMYIHSNKEFCKQQFQQKINNNNLKYILLIIHNKHVTSDKYISGNETKDAWKAHLSTVARKPEETCKQGRACYMNQKHQGKLFHDKCSWLFYVRYLTLTP